MNELRIALDRMTDQVFAAVVQALDDGAVLTVAEIKARTRRGIDIRGDTFKPYAPQYARRKGKSRVNLFDTGEMQGAIDAERLAPHVRRIYIRVPAMERRGRYHQEGTKRLPRREWFGLTPEQEVKIADRMENVIRGLVKEPVGVVKIRIG